MMRTISIIDQLLKIFSNPYREINLIKCLIKVIFLISSKNEKAKKYRQPDKIADKVDDRDQKE